MWGQPGTNPNVGKPLINSSYMFFNSSAERERERDSTFTTKVNTLTYLDKSINHLEEGDT